MRARVKVKSTTVAKTINSLNGLDIDALEHGNYIKSDNFDLYTRSNDNWVKLGTIPDERSAAQRQMDEMWLSEMDKLWFQGMSAILGMDLTGPMNETTKSEPKPAPESMLMMCKGFNVHHWTPTKEQTTSLLDGWGSVTVS